MAIILIRGLSIRMDQKVLNDLTLKIRTAVVGIKDLMPQFVNVGYQLNLFESPEKKINIIIDGVMGLDENSEELIQKITDIVYAVAKGILPDYEIDCKVKVTD